MPGNCNKLLGENKRSDIHPGNPHWVKLTKAKNREIVAASFPIKGLDRPDKVEMGECFTLRRGFPDSAQQTPICANCEHKG